MKKAMVVILVVATGICGAMMFRKPALQSESLPQGPTRTDRDFVSRQAAPAIPMQGVPVRPKTVENAPSGSQQAENKPQKPQVLNPATRPPLPTLSDFTSPTDQSSRVAGRSKKNSSDRIDGTLRQEFPERYHVIVNGDTLARIARRYLGDAQQSEVILRWNREIIRDPNRLPLGKKIRIPSAEDLTVDPTVTRRRSAKESQNPHAPLVPLPSVGTSDG